MKFKFVVELDTEVDSPNAIGEYLRGRFFDQSGGKYGGYSTYDIRHDVKRLPDEVNEHCNDIPWRQCIEWNGIKCRWFWGSDGCLQFIFPDGTILENTDCKKDYHWEWL